MKIQSLLDNANNQFKQNLQDFCKNSDTSQLTEELAEKFIQTIKTAVSQIGTGAVKEFIESFDKIQDYGQYQNGEDTLQDVTLRGFPKRLINYSHC